MHCNLQEIKTPPSGFGTEDGAPLPTTWPFYKEMDALLGDRHIINPPFLLDTSSLASSSTSLSSTSQATPIFDLNNLIFLDDPSASTSTTTSVFHAPSTSYPITPSPSTSTNIIPSPSTSTPHHYSLDKTTYLGSGPSVRIGEKRPAGDPAAGPRKKVAEDPFLAFLREERKQAEKERKEDMERAEQGRKERISFQNSMLALMGKFFEKKD
jgi:hypothetical protein